MMPRSLSCPCLLVLGLLLGLPVARGDALNDWVERFNAGDVESHSDISNSVALAFLEKNIPRFECPDRELERTYYFRWWTYRKHIFQTPEGYVVTEFLPNVPWAQKYNTINCPAGHHFYEGRWLNDGKILDDYARFYFGGGGKPRQYSFWAADSILRYCDVRGDYKLAIDLLDKLVGNYEQWEKERMSEDGLFWQIDDRDGMEVSVGGSGKRATINSYQYGDAVAIAAIARMAKKPEIESAYIAKAERLRKLVNDKLWSESDAFYKTLPRDKNQLVEVRELHGYTPWYFHLPVAGTGREVAWKQIMDPKGFWAPYGPTTAEQRHPGFKLSYEGHECQWNGPGWPYATSITLTAMANVLHDYPQDVISKPDYLKVLSAYAYSQRRKTEDGKVVCWIDENIHPYTGDWISRTMLLQRGNQKNTISERGKDYNHSTFCDLVISGLMGLRPRSDNMLEVHPLIPDDGWDWCRLDRIPYHGRMVTIQWDRNGKKYGSGKGLQVFVDGKLAAQSDKLTRLMVSMP